MGLFWGRLCLVFSLSVMSLDNLASRSFGSAGADTRAPHTRGSIDARTLTYDVDLPRYASRVAAGSTLPHREAPRRRQRKRNIAWEQAELASDGLYARNLKDIEAQFPVLSPMQLRVCALVKAMLPNWKIADILGITEKTLENHLRAARKRLGIAPGTRLNHVLASNIADEGIA